MNPPPFVANLNTSSYDPGLLSAATTYYWRVDEINALGTTTGSLWQFTTADSGSATTVSVSAISLGTSGGGKQGKYGEATVTVIDNLGNLVAGADVSGQFSGSYNESANATTDGKWYGGYHDLDKAKRRDQLHLLRHQCVQKRADLRGWWQRLRELLKYTCCRTARLPAVKEDLCFQKTCPLFN